VFSKPLTVFFNPNFLGALHKFYTLDKSTEEIEKERTTSSMTIDFTMKVRHYHGASSEVRLSQEIELVLLDSSLASSQSLVLSFDIEAHPVESSSRTEAGINNLVMYTA
ncbi:hypothetical protein PMAYCL1PPCAC_07703, partial [Pristionchus mayeri]